MRRVLLIALTLTVLVAVVPVKADTPSDWQGVVSTWLQTAWSWWSFGESRPPIEHATGRNLPYLDPNGVAFSDPSAGDATIEVVVTEDEDDGNTLPYLDPNG